MLTPAGRCPFQTHLPGYVQDYDKLKAAGAEVIACVSVNDPFVMEAWGKEHKADGKVGIAPRGAAPRATGCVWWEVAELGGESLW